MEMFKYISIFQMEKGIKILLKKKIFIKLHIVVILDRSYCPPLFVIHTLSAVTIDDLFDHLASVEV